MDNRSAGDGRSGVPRLVNALGIAILTALATSIPSLLAAVLLFGSDRAVVGALAVGATIGAIVGPAAWWRLARDRVTSPASDGRSPGANPS